MTNFVKYKGNVGVALFATLLLAGCGSSSSGNNDSSSPASAVSAPAVVTGLTVTPGDGENRLTWGAVEGADSYEIYWSSEASGAAREAECDGNLIDGIIGTSFIHTGLTNGVGYSYAVTAVNAGGEESSCPEMSASFIPVASGGGGDETPIYGCNHPDAINYDPTVTTYVPGSCWWPTPTPVPGDTTVPTLVAGPTAGAKTSATRALSSTIDEAGTGYCTAIASGAAAPTSAEVVANSNANVHGTGGTVSMSANGAATCTVTGITVNVTYDFYFVAKDTAGNLQATPSKVTMTSNVACGAGMVRFVGGTFTMGDNTDADAGNPEHTVTLSDFCIDAKEVTQAQHQAWGADTTWTTYRFDADARCGGSRATCPAEGVDWANAQAYCQAQGKRLPTEAEWEYAARNGGTAAVNAYATGDVAIPGGCADANFGWCGGSTSAVGNYAPSASGLYDMAGNVWEWVGDWYSNAYYANGQVNPTGPASGALRAGRGGSWAGNLDSLRASNRASLDPTIRIDSFGFRCASN